MFSQNYFRLAHWYLQLSCTHIRSIHRVVWYALIASFCSILNLSGQRNMVLYNMQYVPQSHQLNPGQMPHMKWHLGLPVLSSIRLGLGSTGFDYDRLDAQIAADEATYSTIISPTAPELNRTVMDFELQLLNFGFQFNQGRSYLSFDLSDAFYASGNYTRDFAIMFDQIDNNQLQGAGSMTFDQSRHDFNLAYYRSYGVGFTQQVNRKLSLGIRARYLQGILSLQSENQGLVFYYPGEGSNFEVEGQLRVMTAGRSLVDEVEGVSSFFPGGNGGFAFDFGGLYRLNDKWEFSLAIQQLGQITWNQDVNYTRVDNQFTFSAVDIDDHFDTWSAVADSLLDGQGINLPNGFTTALPQRYFIGANYFFSPNSSVGLLLNPVSYYRATDLNIALTLQTRLAKILGISGVFGHSRYADFNVGTGISLELGPFQIYALTEALFSSTNWRSAEIANVQLGINFNFGRYKRADLITSEEVEATTEVALVEPASSATRQKEKPEKKSRTDRPKRKDIRKEKADKGNPAEDGSNARAANLDLLPQVSPGYYLFSASIANLQTGLRVERAKYEVYTMSADGEQKLFLIGSVMDGKLSVQLAVNQVYILKILAQGYQDQEVPLRKVNLKQSQTEMRSQIKLVPKDAVTTTPVPDTLLSQPDTISQSGIQQDATTTPLEETKPTTAPLEEASTIVSPSATALPQFKLSQNTSLRRAATHRSGIILRLKAGYQVEVLEKTNDSWWKVKFEEQMGFAKAALLEEI